MLAVHELDLGSLWRDAAEHLVRMHLGPERRFAQRRYLRSARYRRIGPVATRSISRRFIQPNRGIRCLHRRDCIVSAPADETAKKEDGSVFRHLYIRLRHHDLRPDAISGCRLLCCGIPDLSALKPSWTGCHHRHFRLDADDCYWLWAVPL